jgi:hypothetical protein
MICPKCSKKTLLDHPVCPRCHYNIYGALTAKEGKNLERDGNHKMNILLKETNRDELSFWKWVSICWSCYWRIFLTSLLALAINIAVAFVIGFSFGLILGQGVDKIMIPLEIVIGIITTVISFYIFSSWLRWIMRIELSGFKIRLVKDFKEEENLDNKKADR